jgi:hypothetical protein
MPSFSVFYKIEVVSDIETILDDRPQIGYVPSPNLARREGHVPDAIRSVERERCFRAGSQSAPEQLRASCAAVLRPQREVLSLDWDRRGRVTPARQMRRAATSQEDWPGAERKGREPPGKSRGGTPTGERASPSARRIRRCGSLPHASVGVPPPFIL